VLPPCLRQNYNAVFESRSAQFASAEFPRIISTCFLDQGQSYFWNTYYPFPSDFVMSFSGDKTRFGYDRIEAIQFDQSNENFHFETIVFPKDGREIKDPPQIVSYQKKEILTRNGVYLGHEPSNCIKCHHGKPNWDLYYLWPGAIGSFNDNYFGMPSRREKYATEQLINKVGEEGRYSALVPFWTSKEDRDEPTVAGQAEQLTDVLSSMNDRRLGAYFKKTVLDNPKLKKFAYAFLASQIKDCVRGAKTIETFIPENVQNPTHYKSYQALFDDTKRAQNKYTLNRFERIAPDADWLERQVHNARVPKGEYVPAAEEPYLVAAFRYVAQFVGISDLKYWAMTFEPYSYAYNAGNIILGISPPPLRGVVHEARLAIGDAKFSCDELRLKSLEALSH
jgi:hypothetical protein